MDSCSFCAAIAWKLLCLPWACLPESVRAQCLLVATFCAHCCHIALITSLPCLEHLIRATTMCPGRCPGQHCHTGQAGAPARRTVTVDESRGSRDQVSWRTQAPEQVGARRRPRCPGTSALEQAPGRTCGPTERRVHTGADVPEGLEAACSWKIDPVGRTQTESSRRTVSVGALLEQGTVWDCPAVCGEDHSKEGCRTQLTRLWSPIALCTTHTSPVLSDHHERWSPKPQTKLSQWTSVDNLQTWCTDYRNDTYVLQQRMGRGAVVKEAGLDRVWGKQKGIKGR